jgi:DnaJ family protein C protein 3
LKQSQKRDYYKILGVKRTATKSEINKAYRKLAVKWHPDQYKGEDKTNAEKKFIEIAAAKEVLSDPDKRAKFDAGEDPLDPEAQGGGGGGWPFHPGGFGGQGFQFKFHFN